MRPKQQTSEALRREYSAGSDHANGSSAKPPSTEHPLLDAGLQHPHVLGTGAWPQIINPQLTEAIRSQPQPTAINRRKTKVIFFWPTRTLPHQTTNRAQSNQNQGQSNLIKPDQTKILKVFPGPIRGNSRNWRITNAVSYVSQVTFHVPRLRSISRHIPSKKLCADVSVIQNMLGVESRRHTLHRVGAL